MREISSPPVLWRVNCLVERTDMILGFHHASIVVPDLERASAFYRDSLGFREVMEFSWNRSSPGYDQVTGLHGSAGRAIVLSCRNSYLELIQFSSPTARLDRPCLDVNEPGIRHLAFEVDDAGIEYARVKSSGGIVRNPPYLYPEGGSAVYCEDPFCNIIEFTTAGRGFPSLDDL